MNQSDSGSLRQLLHELKQPLNIISLVSGNIRNRCDEIIEPELNQYIITKLSRIEQQTARAADLIEIILDDIDS